MGLKRIKIVRDEALSEYMQWDFSASDINNSLNQWGETNLISDNTKAYPGATLMQYLNGKTDGNYYYSLSSIAKEQIDDAFTKMMLKG
jgi:hypothetical protein